jgi:hypothetical protein
MDIRENFYNKLQTIREEAEVKPNRNNEVAETQKAAGHALRSLEKNDYEGAHAAVKGTPLHQGLKKHLENADHHWRKMNIANNKAGKPSTPDRKASELRNKGKDHQDQAEHHHGKAVEYVKAHMPG